MKRNIFSIAMFAVLSVLVISCGGGDKSGLAIPMDASVVVHINTGSLTKKLSWDEIKQTNWFKELYADADDSLAKKIMDNPGASGIDTEKDMAFFVKKQGRGGYMVFEGSVKDASAFETFNKQINKEATSSKSGDLTIMKLKDGGVLSYDASRFVYVLNAPNVGAAFPPMSGMSEPREPYSFPADSLQMFGAVLYDLPSDQSMYKDDRFDATMKEAGDLHVWINNEKTYGGVASGMMSMLKVHALFDKNATGMSVNFENGKIAIRSKQFFGKDIQKLLEKFPPKDVSADVVNRIPSQNVVAAMAMNYPPEGIKEFLKLLGLDGAANAYMQEVGYSVDEFVKANKGDLVFVVSDLRIDKPKDSTTSGNEGDNSVHFSSGPEIKYLFATSVNDKAAFNKMVTIIATQVKDLERMGMPKLSYTVTDNWFAAGNSEEQVKQFLSGGKTTQPFASRISGQPFGAFVDLHKLVEAGSVVFSDKNDNAMLMLL
ncbi:MAG TPA: DUF4836 family protein [Flavitalea sp.]|nr:DUF4836 family protein [Flavitalea sp.]